MEQQFLTWLKTRVALQSQEVTGIGDDCAIVHNLPESPQVVSTDIIVDQVHFDVSSHSPHMIGRKALAVNLSDIAAMGATPDYALVSLIIPMHWNLTQVQELYEGILQLATEFNIEIIGGDFNRHEGPLTISVTIMGHQTSDALKYRDTALVGDDIYVTGHKRIQVDLGDSVIGFPDSSNVIWPSLVSGICAMSITAKIAITKRTNNSMKQPAVDMTPLKESPSVGLPSKISILRPFFSERLMSSDASLIDAYSTQEAEESASSSISSWSPRSR